ncbi:hypothetical protein GXB85_08495 [Cellulomonas sp. APG4]|uniref:hypothetical protein n=1 Tax=Cellulomonas sp. APG4 TaxID=1538656 RepID=UPI00137AA847|nr:hypothetical protein [Cellulomonas sp. APG4]NCT90983.1 hypothetical protein [Cellulomonas sp. APG4]
MSQHLPARWSERQLLVVLTPEEAVARDEARRRDLPHGTITVAAPYFGDDARLARLEERGLLRPGAVLIQNPMDRDAYVPDDDADVRLAAEKAMHFAALCQVLGARRVAVTSMKTTHVDVDRRADASGAARGVTAGLDIHGANVDSLAQKIDLEITFPGSREPDLVAGRELLARTGLEGDSTLANLLESRGYQRNPVLQRVLTVDLTAESRHVLDSAAKARAAIGQMTLKGGRTVKKSSSYRVTYEVQFPEPPSTPAGGD